MAKLKRAIALIIISIAFNIQAQTLEETEKKISDLNQELKNMETQKATMKKNHTWTSLYDATYNKRSNQIKSEISNLKKRKGFLEMEKANEELARQQGNQSRDQTSSEVQKLNLEMNRLTMERESLQKKNQWTAAQEQTYQTKQADLSKRIAALGGTPSNQNTSNQEIQRLRQELASLENDRSYKKRSNRWSAADETKFMAKKNEINSKIKSLGGN